MLRRRRILGPDHTPSASEVQGAKPRNVFVRIVRFIVPWVIALLVVLGMMGCLQLLYVNLQGSVPEHRLQGFCQALVARDYSTAWEYVDPHTLGSSSDFDNANLARDAQIGPVSRCLVLGRNYFASFNRYYAGFDVAVTLPNGRHQGVIMLRGYSDNERDWQIYGITPDLSLRL